MLHFATVLADAGYADAGYADAGYADAGYAGEHNHRLCREVLDVRETVIKLNPRNRGRRWP